MTTSVTLKHNGPGHHDVVIEVVTAHGGNVIRHELKTGQSIDLYVYRGQFINVSEKLEGNENAQP